jgi:nucleoside-diphosphate-sugar epimerase
MKVTLTGAAGHLGVHVCRALAEGSHAVRATDKLFRADLSVEIEVADLLDRASCYRLMERSDALVHLANHPSFRDGDVHRAFNENVGMNMNVFQAAADLGVKKIVFASSVQVISGFSSGQGRNVAPELPYLPLDGEVPPNPGNPYALGKQASEMMLAYFARTSGMSCVAIRFPALVDDNQLARMAANAAGQSANYNEGYSFLHYLDAASLVEAILRSTLPGFRIYFPAARDNRLRQPAAEVIRTSFPNTPLHRPLAEITSLVDISPIERETGWSPQFGIPG